MNKSRVEVNMKGLQQLLKKIKEPWYVDVGIIYAYKYPNEDVTVAYVGSIHEFGVEDIPKRSWLKMPLETKQKEITSKVYGDVKKALQNLDFKKLFDIIGFECVEVIKKAFDTGGFGTWTPLAEITIALKGHDKILIDSYLLRDRVEYKSGKG